MFEQQKPFGETLAGLMRAKKLSAKRLRGLPDIRARLRLCAYCGKKASILEGSACLPAWTSWGYLRRTSGKRFYAAWSSAVSAATGPWHAWACAGCSQANGTPGPLHPPWPTRWNLSARRILRAYSCSMAATRKWSCPCGTYAQAPGACHGALRDRWRLGTAGYGRAVRNPEHRICACLCLCAPRYAGARWLVDAAGCALFHCAGPRWRWHGIR